MDAAQLASIRQIIQPVAFNAYDNVGETLDITRYATVIDNTVLQEDPVVLEWVGAWLEAYEWVDEKRTQEIFKGDFSIPIDAFEATMKWNRKKFRRAKSLLKLIPLAANMGEAFARLKVKIVAEVLRLNPLAYDDQNLFDTDHVHPDGNTYSNLDSEAVAEPTDIEVIKDVIHVISTKLVENRAVRAELLDEAEVTSNLLLISHNTRLFTALKKIRTMDRINNLENELKGSFSHVHDPRYKDTGAEDSSIDFIWSAPGGPKPVLFVVDEEPSGLEVSDKDAFETGDIKAGMEGFYGAKPGWPQTCYRKEWTG